MNNEEIRKDELPTEETSSGEMSKEEYRRYLSKLSSAIAAGWLFLYPFLYFLLDPCNLYYICGSVLGGLVFGGYLLNYFSAKKGNKKMKTVAIIMMPSATAGYCALSIIILINHL